MGLLNGGLKNIIHNSLKGMALPVVFYRETVRAGTEPWEPAAKIKTEYSAKGFVTDYNERMIDGTIVQRGDKKVILLAGSCTTKPEPGDSVLIDSKYMTIVNVSTDPASASYSIQVR